MILSCGAVIYRKVDGIPFYLLVKSFSWEFPKGRQEEGEDTFTTALREVKEETGLDNLVFPDQEYKDSTPYKGVGGRKITRLYVASTTTEELTLPINPELGKAEHNEYKWCTFEQANLLLSARLRVMLDWANEKVKNG